MSDALAFAAEVARLRGLQVDAAASDGSSPPWDPQAYRDELFDVATEAERLGLVDDALSEVLDGFEADLLRSFSAFVEAEAPAAAEAIGCGVAEAVFGSKDYKNRLDRQMAVGAAAVGLSAVEDAVALALDVTLRRLLVGEAPSDGPRSRRRRRLAAAVPDPSASGV